MRKLLTALILAIGLTTALAIELPSNTSLTLISSNGAVVGVGELEEGELELDLLADFTGLVTFTSVDAEGNVIVLDATVTEGGKVTLIDTATLEFFGLEEVVAALGGQVEISFEDDLDADDLAQEEDEHSDHDEDADDDGPESEDDEGDHDADEDDEDEDTDDEDDEDTDDEDDESDDSDDEDDEDDEE
jgi:hypothetical protein